jgi:hypothetical protein
LTGTNFGALPWTINAGTLWVNATPQRRPADVIGAAVVVAKIATPQHPLFLQRQGAYDASMSTPTLASGADFICRHCGAVYVVSYTELPIADSGSTYCDVCRRQMIQWNSSQEPSLNS